MRTLTMIIFLARDPDALDAMSFEDRRAWGGGWKQFQLLHDGAPDVVVRRALDLDQGVYAAHRQFDPDDSCIVETSAIFKTELADAAEMLRPHVADPEAFAEALVEEADEDEDAGRVARALVEASNEPAAGGAEEAATWVRVFLASVPDALRLGMGIAWEIRTRVHCECAVWNGRTLGRAISFPSFLETLAEGRLRCKRCGSEYTFERAEWEVTASLVPRPLPELPELAQELARAVGGQVAFHLGDQPSAAIRVGDHCRLLITRYGAGFCIQLPHMHPFEVWNREDWLALEPVIRDALGEQAPVLSICDVVLSLARPSNDWIVSFDGAEAMLLRGMSQVDLTQHTASVTVTIRDGSTTHTREVATLAELDGLPAWIDEKARGQAAAREASAAAFHRQQAEQRAAMRVPELAEVMAVLRAGESIQVGGGRSFPTYAMKEGRLIVIQCDDGHTEEHVISEDRLRAAIADAPNVFDAAVQRRSVG